MRKLKREMMLYFYGANLTASWFGPLSFDSSELPIISLYAMYIPIFAMIIVREKGFNAFNRFIAPILSILGSLFMIYAAFLSHGIKMVLGYFAVYAAIMAVGAVFKLTEKKDM